MFVNMDMRKSVLIAGERTDSAAIFIELLKCFREVLTLIFRMHVNVWWRITGTLFNLYWFVLTCVGLVLTFVRLVSDSCWFVLTHVRLVLTRVRLVLTRVDLCWYSCIRIDLILRRCGLNRWCFLFWIYLLFNWKSVTVEEHILLLKLISQYI